jgi:hypothetical protein
LLRQGDRVVLLGLQRAWWLGVYYARTGLYRSPLPPISAGQARRFRDLAGDGGDWAARWAHQFSRWLKSAGEGPLHAGRWTLETGMPTWSAAQNWRRLWATDRDQGHISWFPYGGEVEDARDVLPLRRLSPADAARVKSYRRQFHEGILPPALLWWVSGLDTLLVLDGHDRIMAALAEDALPQVAVLAPADDPLWASARQQFQMHAYQKRVEALQPLAAEGDSMAALKIRTASRHLAQELTDGARAVGRTRAWLLPGGRETWDREAAQVPGWPDTWH